MTSRRVSGAALPGGTTLFHVDPDAREAGLTRVALRAARERAADLGVAYRDELTTPSSEPSIRLVIDARAGLAGADPAALPDPAAQPGPSHVLIELRERSRVLLRDWQDDVSSGSSLGLEEWLDASSARLWSRRRETLRWWSERLGPEHVTVVVPCSEHLDALQGIEELAGLEAGSLRAVAGDRTLTLGETEALRAVNVALGMPGWARIVEPRLVGSWASASMAARTPGRDEPLPALPPWAVERIHEEAAELIAALESVPTRVIGRLECLSEEPAGSTGATAAVDLPSEAAARLALGIVDGLRLGRDRGPAPSIETRELAGVSASRLIAEMAARPARALGNALQRDQGVEAGDGEPGAPGGGPPIGGLPPTLPRGTRLIHIGPSKTGTTALQAALDRARDVELRQGVRYVGWRRHPRAAVLEATGKPSRAPGRATREWRAIVEELRTAAEARTVFSSEELAHGDAAFVRRFVDDIGPSGVHVAVTLRPLARILPSVWQEGVKAGSATPLEVWLQKVLPGPDTTPGLWRRHRHDELVARWAEVVGTEHVTVIVVDDREQSSLPTAFEALLGLQPGTLQLHRDLSNRSLTRGEAEAVRSLNASLESQGLGWDVRRVVVGLGASYRMRLRDPDRDEERIQLPSWAEDTVSQIARDMVAEIARSGVQVIGDLQALTAVGPASRIEPDVPARVPPAAAAAMAIGVLEAGSAVTPPDSVAGTGNGRDDTDWIDSKLAAMPLRDLGRVVGRRAQRSGMSLARRAAGYLPRGARSPR